MDLLNIYNDEEDEIIDDENEEISFSELTQKELEEINEYYLTNNETNNDILDDIIL